MKDLPIVFTLFGNSHFANALHETLGYEIGELSLHQFPDGETSVNINSPIQNRDVIFITSLEHPDPKFLPLLFSAETARALGAERIGLVALYLPYMRQDRQFHLGESVTSTYFARLISEYFDGLITIDPHLHRWHALNEIYSIPAKALHATHSIAKWIKHHVTLPVLIGPDAESAQWVSEIAEIIKVPFLILKKERKGDRQVETSMPEVQAYQHHTPILIDDIISSGVTMIETVNHLKLLQMSPPICIGVHALFAEHAYDKLLQAGVERVVTCNSIMHPSNEIDIKDDLVRSIGTLFFEAPL